MDDYGHDECNAPELASASTCDIGDAGDANETEVAAPEVVDVTHRENLPGVTCLDQVQVTPVRWLLRDWIPLGKLVVLDGDPGVGKSTYAAGLAAGVTTGGLEGDLVAPASVLLLQAEDSLSNTVRPRVEAAGGNVSRVHVITYAETEGGEKHPSLDEHASRIRELIAHYGAKLVVVDPWTAFVGSGINTYKDQDIRAVLTPLARIAEETECTILLVRHLRKQKDQGSLAAGGGSIAIAGAARAVLLLAHHPTQPEARVIAMVKLNDAPMPPSRAIEVADGPNGYPVMEWREPVAFTADDLIKSVDDRSTKLVVATEWLQAQLFAGPKPQAEIEIASESEGIAGATLRRAKKQLGIKSEKIGAAWMWSLS